MRWSAALLSLLLQVILVRSQTIDDSSFHFSETVGGRATWVVDESTLPWIGSFDYIGSDASSSTVLMTVVDSSTGSPLGECSALNTDADDWERFVWTLTADSLQCNVSETNSSRVRFPMTAHPRTFSVRIQSAKGPRCVRDLTVQNERPVGCPPQLRRNSFTTQSFVCGCPHADARASADTSEGDSPEFPIFDLSGTQSPHTAETPAWTVSPCATVQCLNNGTCVVGSDGTASCLCHNGFAGTRCQVDVCSSVPCAHGGQCKAEGSTAVCECPPHTKGILCEQVICEPSCAQGECNLVDGAPMCECNQGFIGPNCNVIDVCIGDAACAVFGEHAKCTLDDASFTTVSAKLINATYDCHCPHPQSGQWMDCMSLVLSSTVPTSEGTDEDTSETSSEEAATGMNTEAVPIIQLGSHIIPTNNSQPAETTHVAIVPAPGQPGVQQGEFAPNPNQGFLPFQPSNNQQQQVGQPATQEMSGMQPFQPSTVAAVEQTVRPPVLPFNPAPHPSPSQPGVQTQQPDIGFIPHGFTPQTNGQPGSFVPNSAFVTQTAPTLAPQQPTISEEEDSEDSGEASTTEPSISGETTAFPQPSPMDISEVPDSNQEENLGAGFESSVIELTTKALELTTPPAVTESEEEELSEETSTLSTGAPTFSTTTPEVVRTDSPEVAETEQPLWPSSGPVHVWTTPSTPATTEASEEESAEEPTTQSVLPFWMMTTRPTVKEIETTMVHEEENVHTEEETETEDERAEHETFNKPVTPPTWHTTTTPETTEETTRESIATGNAGQGGSSAASWIVAIIAIAVLGLLLLASTLFVLRYVKQSRKLHGKYNPAREEHALSAAYSLPMTHVTKEERLI